MPNTLKSRLKRLPLNGKLILIGSGLMILGTFLPWYKDLDKFNTGDMFLGISGPLYLAGLIILLAAIGSFAMITMKIMQKPLPKLPVEEKFFHVMVSGLSLFMLIFSTSVFFHPKFGINVINKNMGFGMYMTFIGAGMVMAGGVMAIRNKGVNFDEEGHLEPLIDIEKERNRNGLNGLDSEAQRVKNAVQESIEDFTTTNDIR